MSDIVYNQDLLGGLYLIFLLSIPVNFLVMRIGGMEIIGAFLM